MNIELTGILGWVLIVCLSLVVLGIIILGTIGLLFLVVHYTIELLYKFKVNKDARKVFWYFITHREEIEKYISKQNNK